MNAVNAVTWWKACLKILKITDGLMRLCLSCLMIHKPGAAQMGGGWHDEPDSLLNGCSGGSSGLWGWSQGLMRLMGVVIFLGEAICKLLGQCVKHVCQICSFLLPFLQRMIPTRTFLCKRRSSSPQCPQHLGHLLFLSVWLIGMEGLSWNRQGSVAVCGQLLRNGVAIGATWYGKWDGCCLG